MKFAHHHLFASSASLLTLAGLAVGAAAELEPKAEAAQVERIVIRTDAGEVKTGHFQAFSDGDVNAQESKRRRVIGVTLSNVSDALAAHLSVEPDKCVIISRVEPDSPAERAGLKAHDVVVSVNDSASCSAQTLAEAINATKDDDVVQLRVRRGNDEKVVVVKPEVHANFTAAASKDVEEIIKNVKPGQRFVIATEGDEPSTFTFQADDLKFKGADDARTTFERFLSTEGEGDAFKALDELQKTLKAFQIRIEGDEAADVERELQKALESLRSSLRASGSANFTIGELPQVEFLVRKQEGEADNARPGFVRIEKNIDVSGAGVKGKAMYIPSIELDGLKVFMESDSDDAKKIIKAITVAPDKMNTETLTGSGVFTLKGDSHGVFTIKGSDGVFTLRSEGDGAIKFDKDIARFAKLREGAPSLEARLERIESKLDQLERLLERLLDNMR